METGASGFRHHQHYSLGVGPHHHQRVYSIK